MSVAVWPEELPCPLRAPYQAKRTDTRQRRLAGGPIGYSRRFSSAPKIVNLGIETTRAQKAIFDNFYDHTLKDGSLPFWMPDPTTDGVSLLDAQFQPILFEVNKPLAVSAKWLVLFGEETPTETQVGGQYLISYSVAVLP